MLFDDAPLLTVYKTTYIENDIGGRIVTETEVDFTFHGHLDLVSSEPQYADRPFSKYKAFIPDASHVIIAGPDVGRLFIGKGKPRLVDYRGREYRVQYVDNPVGMNIITEIYIKMEG